jgi:CubicO group peptidase (beta-lactamase class C family)
MPGVSAGSFESLGPAAPSLFIESTPPLTGKSKKGHRSRNPVFRFRTWFVPLAALATCGGVRCDSIDDTVVTEMKRHAIAGLSLAVVQDGAIVKASGYGLTAGEGSPPVTSATLFQAGSVSKSVAAMGALRLVEEGKLSLDTDVNGTLKAWHLPENEFTKDSKVTLRRILSHSAGLTVHGFGGYAVGDPLPTLVQVLDGGGNSDPIRVDTVPGSKWRYSGGGYTIMQEMVIEVTGEPFAKVMRENVLDPLGMSSSSYEQPMSKEFEARAATGHLSPGKVVPGGWHVYPEMAAAGLWTTPSELARFVIAVQNSYSGRSNPAISQKMTREMLSIQKADDGLGVFIAGDGATRRFWHNGRDEGFDALMVGYVEKGQGAVVMINANDDSSAVRKIVDAIADTYAWPDYPRFKPAKAIEDREPAVTTQVRNIFERSQTGGFDRSLFTPKLADIIAASLAGPLAARLREMGPVQTFVLIKRDDQDGLRIYHYRVACQNDTILLTSGYTPDGKIASLYFRPE